MLVSRFRVLIGLFAVLLSTHRVPLSFFMITVVMMVGRFVMMMSCSLMFCGRIVMMVTRRVLFLVRHEKLLTKTFASMDCAASVESDMKGAQPHRQARSGQKGPSEGHGCGGCKGHT
jgi:hypothetical protein